MKKNITLFRLICLLAVLALLPCQGLADHGLDEFDATCSFDYSIDSIQLNVRTYPADLQKLLKGLSDLLAITTLKGDVSFLTGADSYGGISFRVNADLELNRNPNTLTHFELYGVNSHYYLESSLLNDRKLVLNNEALLEFAMKAYYHLEMPIQYLALAVAPHATSYALENLLWVYNWYIGWPMDTFMTDRDQFVLDKSCVMTVASELQASAESDRAFNTWVSALLMESGYSDAVFEFFGNLESWADELFVEGITGTRDADGTITWTTGGRTLFTHSLKDDHERWMVDIPDVLEGCPVHVDIQRDGSAWHITASVRSDEITLLDFDLSVSALPDDLPFDGSVTADIHLAGEMVMGGFDTRWQAISENGAFTVCQINPGSGETMLSVSGTWKDRRPSGISTYYPWLLDGNDALNIFSVNDTTLPEFINSVKKTIVKGGIALAREMPASGFQSLFEFLDEYNILDVLTGGLSD